MNEGEGGLSSTTIIDCNNQKLPSVICLLILHYIGKDLKKKIFAVFYANLILLHFHEGKGNKCDIYINTGN